MSVNTLMHKIDMTKPVPAYDFDMLLCMLDKFPADLSITVTPETDEEVGSVVTIDEGDEEGREYFFKWVFLSHEPFQTEWGEFLDDLNAWEDFKVDSEEMALEVFERYAFMDTMRELGDPEALYILSLMEGAK